MSLHDQSRMALLECIRVMKGAREEAEYLEDVFTEHWTGNFEHELDVIIDLLTKEVNSSYCPNCEHEVDTEENSFKDVLNNEGMYYSVYLVTCKECARVLDKSSWIE